MPEHKLEYLRIGRLRAEHNTGGAYDAVCLLLEHADPERFLEKNGQSGFDSAHGYPS